MGSWYAVTVFPGDYTRRSKPGAAVLFFARALSNTGRSQQFWYRVVLSCSTVPGSRTRNLRWQTSWQLFAAPPSGGASTGVQMITAGTIDKRCRRFGSDTGQTGAEKSIYWESAAFSPGRTASNSVGAGFISLA